MTKKFLFVCTGNTCRSPLAERFFTRLAREQGFDAAATSAGTQAAAGSPLSEGAAAVFLKKNISIAPHRARRVDAAMLKDADAVYALESMHRDYLKRLHPEHASKISVLSSTDIKDPVGGDALEYEACAASIEEALKIIILKVRKNHAPNPR